MKFTSLKVLFACLLGFSGLAHGALISSSANTYGASDADVTLDSNQFEFEWVGTPVSLSVLFTSNSSFSLSLDSFISNGSRSDVTGFTLDMINGPATTRLTTDTNFCHSAQSDIAGSTGACNLFALSGVTGTNANTAYEPGEMLFSSLDAGTYRLGIYDSGSPNQGTATIGYAQVPAPATGILLVVGLGALALRRR